MSLVFPSVYLLPERIQSIASLRKQFSRPSPTTIWRRISQYHRGCCQWVIVTSDHIGDVGDIGTDGEAGIVVDALVGKFPFTAG